MSSERATAKYMETKRALKQFGLNEKQARVYLATLELGAATAAKIADKARLPRPTCYDVLSSLVRQGIASSFATKGVRHFSVDDPKKIVNLAEQNFCNLKAVLPQLEAIYGLAKERPTVRFYQGKEGMKQVFEEMLSDKKDILAFSSADDLFKCLGGYWPKFIEKRRKSKILVRAILRDSPKARERQQLGPQELRVVKLIPSQFSYHGAIFIFGCKVAFFSFLKDYVAVVMESSELADVERSALEYIWQQAGDYK